MMKWHYLGMLILATSFAFAETQIPEPRNETEAKNLKTAALWNDQVWGKGRLELISELVTPEYTRHEGGDTRVVTREEYASEIEENLGRGVKFTMHAMTIDNNLLWTRWSSDATILGFDLAIQGIQIYRFEDGRLTETWLIMDLGDHWPDY